MTERWIKYFLFMALSALSLLFALNMAGYGPAVVKHEKVRVVLPPQQQALPAPAVVRKAAPANKKAVAEPAPASAVSALAPSVQATTPIPAATPPAPATPETIINVYPPAPAPMPVPPPPVVQQKKVQSATGLTFQFNVFANGNWSSGYRYGGSVHGWTPGHVARVCEQRSTGQICFDRWIPHPHPGYGY